MLSSSSSWNLRRTSTPTGPCRRSTAAKLRPSSGTRAPGQPQSSTTPSDKAFEDWLNEDLSSYQGAQESRYVGFGNTAPPQKRDDDFLNNAMSSLYSGWSSFATGASKFASAAKEGATKFGSQASQKASELGHSLNENVLRPAQEKVKEGKIFDDVTSGVSQLASKVQGVGSRGWRDVTTFFSGRADDSSDRPPDGQGYQSSSVDQSFWETFGSNDPAKAHRSPSSDSWTCADASAEKRSSDSWDVWGSGSASNSKSSDHSDVGEAWGEGRAKAARKPATPATQVDEGWDNQDW
nr:PREDICTED: ADP-ribosylation factor GTPase-activating protein 1 isoform X11 [Rhinolophus sinicus]